MNSQAFSVARSLKRKLLLPLLLVGAALAAATVWGICAKSQKLLAEKLRLRAELVASAVIYAAESVSQPGELQRIVAAIGAEEAVSLIVVVGGRPARVLAATRTAWLGRALTALPVKAVAEDLAEAIQTRQSHSHLHLDMAQVDVTSPLLLSRPELADQSLTGGAVMVRLDLRPTQAAMRQLTLEFSTAFLATLVILAALGYGLVHHVVLRPIARIGTLVEHRPAGAGESWAEAATDDELGALARTLSDSLTRTDAMLHELEDQKNALRASEERFRSLFESSRDAVMTLEPPAWKFTSGNPAALAMFGAGNEAHFVTLGPWELSPERQPDGRASAEKAKEMIETAMREGSHFFEWTHQRINGQAFPATVLLSRIESAGKVFLQGTTRDITEQKQAEEEKARMLAIIEESPDFIGLADPQGNLLFHNRAANEMVGLPADADLTHMKIRDMHPGWAAKLVEEEGIPTILREGLWRSENVLLHRNGSEIPVSQVMVLHRDFSGEPKFISTIMRDITERKRAEEALRESRQLLRQILDAIPVRVFWKDLNFKYLGCNLPFALDSGLQSPEEMIGRDDLEMRWKTHAELYRADDRRVILSGQPKLAYEEPQTKPDGSGLLWLRTSKVPLRDAAGRVMGVLGIYEDITERKRAEAERERLIVELQSALAHIKTLSGLIPICSGCKKIRDDKNYWHQVDTYIAEHTSALFTHGLCPECVKKYFPDL
jgi:PAS domain S-box-containing protein